MQQPDPAIAAAAVVCRMRYQDVEAAVRQYRDGFRHLPGTMYRDAVIAWRAAQHALDHAGEKPAP